MENVGGEMKHDMTDQSASQIKQKQKKNKENNEQMGLWSIQQNIGKNKNQIYPTIVVFTMESTIKTKHFYQLVIFFLPSKPLKLSHSFGG